MLVVAKIYIIAFMVSKMTKIDTQSAAVSTNVGKRAILFGYDAELPRPFFVRVYSTVYAIGDPAKEEVEWVCGGQLFTLYSF